MAGSEGLAVQCHQDPWQRLAEHPGAGQKAAHGRLDIEPAGLGTHQPAGGALDQTPALGEHGELRAGLDLTVESLHRGPEVAHLEYLAGHGVASSQL